MNKKIWLTLASVFVAFSVLVGCNAVDNDEGQTDQPGTEQDGVNDANDMEMDEEMDQNLPDGDNEDNLEENGVNGDNGIDENGNITNEEPNGADGAGTNR